MKKILLLGLISMVTACTNSMQNIDRQSVVDRHKITVTGNNPKSPAQVGNGEFAFGMDITGLQTFTAHNIMAHWAWHSFPLPDSIKIEDFKGQTKNTHGRDIMYWIGNNEQRELSDYLAGNPHAFNLGHVGFIIKKQDGSRAQLPDLKNTVQETNLWTGEVISYFEIDHVPVKVITVCHSNRDAIGVKVEAPLAAKGQIAVEFAFPYPTPDGSQQFLGTYDKPEAHTSQLSYSAGKKNANIRRALDDARYTVSINWENKATFAETEPHHFVLQPDENVLAFTCEFLKEDNIAKKQSFKDCQKSSVKGWKDFWLSGAAIDLSGSTDARWKELERRIVLSQYLMKINEAGSYPPQEAGLVNNGWYGRFHFEMIWWHTVHYALWNRWELMDRCMHVFPDFLPTSVERARQQGYAGARWAKCTGNIDREWPHPIDALLIWQQPHPIYYAELDYRLHPSPATLEKWKDIVFASADFMADYAFFDSVTNRYILGPPMYVVSETTPPDITVNPTFELAYWRFGLRVAQTWRERLSLPRDRKWDAVLSRLAPLPVEDSVYVTYEGIPDMWSKWAYEHPALIGVFGMLPGDGIDTTTFVRTLNRVFEKWNFNWTWGWDFPMLAMAAARTGQPEKAIDMLLYPTKAFDFDEHGLASGGPFPYFPSNGALLTAVAMMTGGWDGAQDSAPGFPKNGKWKVKHEGFNKMP
jgi:hypothetical protein